MVHLSGCVTTWLWGQTTGDGTLCETRHHGGRPVADDKCGVDPQSRLRHKRSISREDTLMRLRYPSAGADTLDSELRAAQGGWLLMSKVMVLVGSTIRRSKLKRLIALSKTMPEV